VTAALQSSRKTISAALTFVDDDDDDDDDDYDISLFVEKSLSLCMNLVCY